MTPRMHDDEIDSDVDLVRQHAKAFMAAHARHELAVVLGE